ncbi:MAG: 6-bladed beta-propeller [Gemmatimonadales bacterium]|jgi:hypothetical protein
MKQWLAVLASILVLAGSAAACGRSEARDLPATGTAGDSAGVTVWTIPGTDVQAPFRLAPEARLAIPDSGWSAYPDDVGIDRRGQRIYVLDEAAPRVLVFDFDGALVGELGREGQGPGEYVDPVGLAVDREGRVHVIDPGRGSIHVWSAEGEYLDSREMAAGYWGPGFAITPDGPIYTTSGEIDDGVMTDALVRTSAGIDTLHTVATHWQTLEMPCGSVPVPQVFYLSNVWAAADGRIAVADVPRYQIDLHDGQGRTTTFRRAVPPRRVSRAEAEEFVGTGPLHFLVEHCGMTPAGVVSDAGFVEEVSPFFALTLGPDGRVWAARGVAPEVEAIDVFDPERGYVGTVESRAFPVAFLDEARFVTILPGTWGTELEIRRIVPR